VALCFVVLCFSVFFFLLSDFSSELSDPYFLCFMSAGSSSMANRQKSIRDTYFTKSRDTNFSINDNIISVHSPTTAQAHARALWKEQWALQFK
jgi:hypothetical protein